MVIGATDGRRTFPSITSPFPALRSSTSRIYTSVRTALRRGQRHGIPSWPNPLDEFDKESRTYSP